MPHAELKFSSDLGIEAEALLRGVEQVILRHDAESGDCKGRAYPAAIHQHNHCLLEVSMLTKPHRDAVFTRALLQDLEAEMKKHLTERCFLSLGIRYSDDNYVTTEHIP